jgi:seryl-tRNA synthetase
MLDLDKLEKYPDIYAELLSYRGKDYSWTILNILDIRRRRKACQQWHDETKQTLKKMSGKNCDKIRAKVISERCKRLDVMLSLLAKLEYDLALELPNLPYV